MEAQMTKRTQWPKMHGQYEEVFFATFTFTVGLAGAAILLVVLAAAL
jgi:hypothetical protein